MFTFLEPQTGRVFTSPNVTEAPPAVILPPVSGPDDLVDNIGKLRFMSSKYPQLPYAFQRPVNSGSLFSCLRLPDHQLPIVNSQGFFSLDSTLRNQWLELDNFLTRVFRILPVGCPPDVSLFPVPSDARYASPHKTEAGARDATKRARKAFQHLIALCSWGLSRYIKHEKDHSWVQTLLSGGLSPPMVEMLRESVVAEFQPFSSRVGAVVDVKDLASLAYVHRMAEAKVAVYIYWGICEPYTKPKFNRVPECVEDAYWINGNCYPSETIIKDALFRSPALPPPSSTSTGASLSTQQPSPAPVLVTPPPVKGSGQRRGETWREFFARRSQANSVIEQEESVIDRKKREQRTNNAKTCRPPGRKGANVFQWEELNGHRIRTPIGYNSYQGIWCDYQGAQRRYDAYNDEWDLCTEFDADATLDPAEDFDDSDSDDEPPMLPQNNAASTSLPAPPAAEYPPQDRPMPSNPLLNSRVHPINQQSLSGNPTLEESLPANIPRIEETISTDCSLAGETMGMAPPPTEESMGTDPPPTEESMSTDAQVVEESTATDSPPADSSGSAVGLPVEGSVGKVSPQVMESASVDQPPSEETMTVDHSMSIVAPTAPLNRLPDPQASSNLHPASVFVGADIPENQAVPTMDLQEVLAKFYGFTCSASSVAVPQTNAGLSHFAIKVCESAASLPSGASLRNAMTVFLEKLTTGQPFDPALCDLLDGSLLEVLADGDFIVRRREGLHIAVDGTKTTKGCYMIAPKVPSTCPFVIFLDDPVAVLYALRVQTGSELSALVVELTRRGIPISTRVLLDAVPRPVYTSPSGLGFLPFGYRPHSSDYVMYLERRDTLLRRNYGRAAILKGGIIGRLARESLGDRADFVSGRGPSDDVVRFGSCIEIGGKRYWDDDLDCEDEEIVCGVYKLSTGQRHHHNGQQTADVSWWPKQSIWLASGLSISYWSADDEAWYQKHLRRIRTYDGTGTVPYRTSSEWRNALKYHKDATRKSRDYATRIAEQWLKDYT
ncbi:hypothetical protein J3R83DRAFT_11699 [Lanmaoa asiatica]|nr:hypothetical protein J3R83DRAFT_11745 [Lanmaoa asiatica]KAH0825673.1 hypothetical protein J3R83DRAFT_11699 [Lanmaoa asiatica]